ncbi:MAG: sigma 54-interacting transcriptional regulator [Polyangiaceae bacterium]
MTGPPPGESTERLSSERAAALRPAGMPQQVSLLLHYRDGANMVPLLPGQPVVVGRSPAADMYLEDRSLSRAHARFTLKPSGTVLVDDLGSTNGTWLAGRRITSVEVATDTELTLGNIIASLHVLTPGSQQPEVLHLQRHDDLRRWLDAEIARARFFRRQLTFALVRASQTGSPLRRWSPTVQARLRPVDQSAIYSGDTLEVLLPEMSTDEAKRFLPELIAGDRQGILCCGAAVFPESARSAEELIEVARRALSEANAGAPLRIAPPDETSQMVSTGSNVPLSASAKMQEVLATAARVARSAIPVLITGETGTGKEVIARYIHASSPRKDGPLITVNCGSIPPTLVESALFGHEKGAFTGAAQQAPGVFAAASGGIVFLDEIGELPAPAQAALLRVLETKKVMRVGSTRETDVDVRVLAATHRDLDAMVRDGKFRQDLLYRLNTMTIALPPLRERREEIPALTRRFLEEANAHNGTHVEAIEADALALLERHNWPGNVRELRNAIERAVVICDGRTVRVEDLPMGLASAGTPPAEDAPSSGNVDAAGDFWTRVERFESELLTEALRSCNGNQRAAALRLGVPLRTLVHKIRAYNLKRAPTR